MDRARVTVDRHNAVANGVAADRGRRRPAADEPGARVFWVDGWNHVLNVFRAVVFSPDSPRV